ncbi:MAG: endonuclease III domain-containing protein [Deltaproteobacteria bacterium]|nr:endonuclease III domain-containing protein [Deltaproteobacteria bacterium]MBW2136635.1 endonuclease III domain-containing protein [Deltaproteobacteria bacterium]
MLRARAETWVKGQLSLITKRGEQLMEMYEILLSRFGPQYWWPGETELEVMVGAVLTQNTNWKNVERAIKRLKEEDMLSLRALHSLSIQDLARMIRPAGYYNVKARRLKNLVRFVLERCGEDLSLFLNQETDELRDGLLSVKGIGEETADSILLYAARRPVFVIDAYTYRILSRHGMVVEQSSYSELQSLFMDNLPRDRELYGEFHALIVRTGKEFCLSSKPKCRGCPLGHWGDIPPLN